MGAMEQKSRQVSISFFLRQMVDISRRVKQKEDKK